MAMDRSVRAARLVGWALFVAALGLFACGGPQEPAEEGEDCYRDSDCKVGLVCVPNPANQTRTCSKNISGLVSMVDGPPDAGMPVDDGAVPTDDGAAPTDDAGQ